MSLIKLVILCCLLFLTECYSQADQPPIQEPNALINETSPYLLQHANNPVDWYPWKAEALQKAQDEQKMMIISIGYSACHWCHVMEHESFEDTTVSRIMNENFINIKVDREERPDVDDVYMTACQLATGESCGWPLNAFALPDGRPVWAGTYFPKKNWIEILNYFKDLYQTDREKLETYADQLVKGIQTIDDISIPADLSDQYSAATLQDITQKMLDQIDPQWGGRKGAPKFPMPNQYELLLNQYFFTQDTAILDAVTVTLDQMAKGGIYDHLGGGFARYSTDSEWKVPHFEKMLYDNAQLVSLYAHAYQITQKPLYKKIVQQTLKFIERELSSPSGGFYSSLDADSEGEEGKFYVWEKAEIDSILHDQKAALVFNDLYEVSTRGNWENTNILHQRQPIETVAQTHQLDVEQTEQLLKLARNQLFEARSHRERPGLDDKMLTSWNALMIQGYLNAYRALGEDAYLKTAVKNAEFLLDNVLYSPTEDHYHLYRNYKNDTATIRGFLDDYAAAITAFTQLYEVTFEEKWLHYAEGLAETAIEEFHDPESGLFFYTSDLSQPLVARKKEIGDNVIPSSNSMMVRVLHQLGTYLYQDEYLKISQKAIQIISNEFNNSNNPSFYSNWWQLYSTLAYPTYEVAIVGPGFQELHRQMLSRYLPNAIFLGGNDEGKLELLENKLVPGETYIYVCQNKVCQLPVQKVQEALEQMR